MSGTTKTCEKDTMARGDHILVDVNLYLLHEHIIPIVKLFWHCDPGLSL